MDEDLLDAATLAASKCPGALAFGLANEVLPRMPAASNYSKKLDCSFVASFYDTKEEFLEQTLQAAGYGRDPEETPGVESLVSQAHSIQRTCESLEEVRTRLHAAAGVPVPEHPRDEDYQAEYPIATRSSVLLWASSAAASFTF